MFKNDLARAKRGAETFYIYQNLNDTRRAVLIEMTFQMGVRGVGKFRRFFRAVEAKDWEGSYKEMLDSKWHYIDSPARALELAILFRSGRP